MYTVLDKTINIFVYMLNCWGSTSVCTGWHGFAPAAHS